MMRNFVRVFLIVSGIPASAAERPFTTWSQYLGGADSSQYSSLRQINKSNVAKLQVAWTYPTGPGTFVFDPVVVDGVMYVLKESNAIAALDAATGKELWVHPNTGAVGTRGMNYWGSKDRSDRRLFFFQRRLPDSD
jgi:quinoprotein glucose dehydrogenase